MTQTTSHALEDKYNAEDDAKKISIHEASKEPEKTNLDKLPAVSYTHLTLPTICSV